MKGSLSSLSPFPETLLRYSNFHTVFYRTTASGDHQFDDTTCKILGLYTIKQDNLELKRKKSTRMRIYRCKKTLLSFLRVHTPECTAMCAETCSVSKFYVSYQNF